METGSEFSKLVCQFLYLQCLILTQNICCVRTVYRGGYRFNFIDSNSAYRIRFLSNLGSERDRGKPANKHLTRRIEYNEELILQLVCSSSYNTLELITFFLVLWRHSVVYLSIVLYDKPAGLYTKKQAGQCQEYTSLQPKKTHLAQNTFFWKPNTFYAFHLHPTTSVFGRSYCVLSDNQTIQQK